MTHGIHYLWFAIGALAISTACSALAEPPIPPGLPIGHEEWTKTGQLPKSLFLQDYRGDWGAVMSTPDAGGWAGFSVWDMPKDPSRRELRIGEGDRQPLEKSTYMPGGYVFDVGDRDVIPLYDQVYSVNVKDAASKEVLLTRVTDRISKELRPGLHTRTISRAAVWASLFWEQHPKFEKRQDYDTVKLEFDPASKNAVLRLYPTFMFTPPLTEEEKTPNRERLQLEVKKGRFLTARGRSYKVLNVVPPQDIVGVGHLVGWIELAADPEASPWGVKGDKSNY
jgi:hypothetical protein